MKLRERELFNAAVRRWGASFQLDMAIEEASELIFAICKLKRRRDDSLVAMRHDIIEEMADVDIMLQQLKVILGVSDEEYLYIKKSKLRRLRSRLK
ncbi:MAG: hypothetical protein JRJ66_01560 [Deltaproteobacteria bacterium]|nr:hypothetical protein [Deltaproteobacteria bacterium]MBW2081668.1 hypothetical protein [Deltaproteobacteria bacterium]MBW2298862.1 hypothetical protein [Deltaproteobacteria bacterium]